MSRADILCAIQLLSADDLAALARRLAVPPELGAIQRACKVSPGAHDAVTRFLFGPPRSRTPPRQIMRPPLTPPPVVRVRRAAIFTPKHLRFD